MRYKADIEQKMSRRNTPSNTTTGVPKASAHQAVFHTIVGISLASATGFGIYKLVQSRDETIQESTRKPTLPPSVSGGGEDGGTADTTTTAAPGSDTERPVPGVPPNAGDTQTQAPPEVLGRTSREGNIAITASAGAVMLFALVTNVVPFANYNRNLGIALISAWLVSFIVGLVITGVYAEGEDKGKMWGLTLITFILSLLVMPRLKSLVVGGGLFLSERVWRGGRGATGGAAGATGRGLFNFTDLLRHVLIGGERPEIAELRVMYERIKEKASGKEETLRQLKESHFPGDQMVNDLINELKTTNKFRESYETLRRGLMGIERGLEEPSEKAQEIGEGHTER